MEYSSCVRVLGALVAFFASSSICVAASLACPPIGTLPGYVPGPEQARVRSHDAHVFWKNMPDGSVVETSIAGRFCSVRYVVVDEANPLSNLEIHTSYREQIRQLGGLVTHADEVRTSGHIGKDGAKTWVHVWSAESLIELAVVEERPAPYVLVASDASDYRLFGHMPGYAAGEPVWRNFDQAEFAVRTPDGDREVNVQGAKFAVEYRLLEGALPRAGLDIHENYRSVIKKLGGEILYADEPWTTARLLDGDQAIWVKLYAQEELVELLVIEEKAFTSSLTPPKSDDLLSALEKDGRVAIYVNFDFAKSTLKKDAQPVVDQVAAMLKADSSLQLSIEGHTDDVGGNDANRVLSRQRAQSVVDALVAQGVAGDRLKSEGFGPNKPLGSNDSSEGRARNRRVELVRR